MKFWKAITRPNFFYQIFNLSGLLYFRKENLTLKSLHPVVKHPVYTQEASLLKPYTGCPVFHCSLWGSRKRYEIQSRLNYKKVAQFYYHLESSKRSKISLTVFEISWKNWKSQILKMSHNFFVIVSMGLKLGNLTLFDMADLLVALVFF